MADTYTQLYIQFVFAVQNRKSLIHPEWETELHKYITGIIQNKSHKMIAINGMPDHLHMFIGFQPVDHMSELIKVVKGESSKWIKERGLIKRGRLRRFFIQPKPYRPGVPLYSESETTSPKENLPRGIYSPT